MIRFEDRNWITPKQLGQKIGMHEGSIRRGIREHRIPAKKINGRWYIDGDEVLGECGAAQAAPSAPNAASA